MENVSCAWEFSEKSPKRDSFGVFKTRKRKKNRSKVPLGSVIVKVFEEKWLK